LHYLVNGPILAIIYPEITLVMALAKRLCALNTTSEYDAHMLVVDDDDNLRMIISDRLSAMGYCVDRASSLREALDKLGRESYQLLLLDIYLPDQRDLEGLSTIRERFPALPIIVMTAHGTIDLAVQAMKVGAFDFVTKPLDFERLGVLAARAVESSALRTEVNYLRRTADKPFSDIIGEQTGLKGVMALVRMVADSDTTVLLRGETGTGKEVIARAIHRLSSRKNKPFVVANCAAIPRELMESEMFGHTRGSFTGAIATHAGFFETAGGGSLLLDEIGDLNMDLQAKILRVLEDGSYRRVGSATALHNRARIITSTHQPLERHIEEGRFREDLFYRLNVFPIELPPLRARKEDIPSLARHFLRLAIGGKRSGEMLISEGALAALQDHPWWGNLRELRNCMERLAITVPGPVIAAEDIKTLLNHRPAKAPELPVSPLRDLEKQAILEALERFDGNRTKAAAALGIGRRTLQNKIKLYGMSDDRYSDDTQSSAL
jgi:DNA-binding NtrC family response regulator